MIDLSKFRAVGCSALAVLAALALSGCSQGSDSEPPAQTSGGTGGGPAACAGVDLQSDPANCGACGNACPSSAACVGGACQCPGGTEACGAVCAETSSDSAHCGTCGVACAPGEFCLGGACGADCGDLTACGASCVDTQASALHCGACGAACGPGQSCESGTCACPSGLSACSTGCFDLQGERSNCGTCGTACGLGELCQSGACACVTGSVSFAGEVQPIFDADCTAAGCHSGRRPAATLDLTAGAAYGSLVNVAADLCGGTLVTPGDPADSYLMHKLTGIDICAGTEMPKTGASLPEAQLDAIASWICSGAADN